MLAPELAARLSADRFELEISLVESFQESHIVPMLSVGIASEGLPCYTMPLVEGESLRARLNRGPIVMSEARRAS